MFWYLTNTLRLYKRSQNTLAGCDALPRATSKHSFFFLFCFLDLFFMKNLSSQGIFPKKKHLFHLKNTNSNCILCQYLRELDFQWISYNEKLLSPIDGGSTGLSFKIPWGRGCLWRVYLSCRCNGFGERYCTSYTSSSELTLRYSDWSNSVRSLGLSWQKSAILMTLRKWAWAGKIIRI